MDDGTGNAAGIASKAGSNAVPPGASRSIARAEAVLDRAARMRQFKAGWTERRLFDPQMRTPGHVGSAVSMNWLTPEMLKNRRTAEVPLSQIRTEQPSVSVAAVKAKLGSPGKPPLLVKDGDFYRVADGNHRITAARALGQKTLSANVADIAGEIKGPAVNLSPATIGRGMRTAANIGAPLAVGANALLAYAATKKAGGSTFEAAGSAAMQGGQTAATGIAIGAGLRGASALGLKGTASFAARALVPLSIAGHAAGYAYGAWSRGEGAGGILKSAAWGAVNGVIPIDLTAEALGNFNSANSSYSGRRDAAVAEKPQGERRRKGWGNAARAASAARRGAKWEGPTEGYSDE